jgi:hypothetical protein
MTVNEGPELDALVQERVFGGTGGSVPPFSTRDWTALALAELVSDRRGWRYHLIENDGVWTAVWLEPRSGPRGIQTLVSSRAPTRALALCRGLLKAARSPRWTRGPSPAMRRPREAETDERAPDTRLRTPLPI